jgi:hypothetical protein
MKLTRTTRNVGWLVVAGLLGAALIAPAGVSATGNPPSTECAGFTYWFKIDSLSEAPLEEKTYTDADGQVETNWPDQEITISNLSEDGQTFDWASTEVVSKVVSKEGSDEFSSTTGLPGTSGSVADATQQGLSHVTFCGNAVTTTETETTETETTETETTETETTTTATGSVQSTTSKAKPTPPSTDTVVPSSPSSTTGSPWSLLLVAMAALLAATLLLTPAVAARKR